jgi:hypothetical protein
MHHVDRVSGEPIRLLEPCVTVLWLVQPDKLEQMFRAEPLTRGGLLPRFCVCHTNAEMPRIDRTKAGVSEDAVIAWHQLVSTLFTIYRLSDLRVVLTADEAAIQLLDAHHERVRHRRLCDPHDIHEFSARWNEQAWRLALVLHAGLWGGEAHKHRVAVKSARAAIAIAEWFSQQQLHILEGAQRKKAGSLAGKVLALLSPERPALTATDVYRARIVPNAEQAHTLLQTMEKAGQLTSTESQPSGGGHITRTYQHPKR